MGVTFNGPSKLIVLTPGTTSVDVGDVYSRWKDWMLLSDNAKYLPAFSVVGGDPTVDGNTITPYFFLENGWRIRPQEAAHVLKVNGIVLVPGGVAEPFVATLGAYNVSIRSIVPIRTETVVSGGGGGGGGEVDSFTQGALDQMVGAVFGAPASGHDTAGTMGRAVNDSKAAAVHRVSLNKTTGVLTIYEVDGVTPRATFQIRDDQGSPSSSKQYDRDPE